MYDLIIKNGTIIDGSGSPSFCGDIAIKNGKISRIAESIDEFAEKIIDAKGLTVTPGFIDSHSHSDDAILEYPEMIEKVEQGITTAIGGQCGDSAAPRRIIPENDREIEGFGKLSDIVKNFTNFVLTAKRIPLGANNMMFVGHSDIRISVIGYENRKATKEELEKMKELVREAMKNGALGLSFGLVYTPSCYADTEELLELSKVVKEYGGMLAAHLRSEGDKLIEAVEEFLYVAKTLDIKAVFSHHKAVGRKNWGKVNKTLPILKQAIEEGYDIYCDVYPYPATNTSLKTVMIPRKMRALPPEGIVEFASNPENRKKIKEGLIETYGEKLDSLFISGGKGVEDCHGKLVSEIAEERGQDPYDVAFDIIRDSNSYATVCVFSVNEDDIDAVMKFERAMICTDSGVAGKRTTYHPRLRGSFPRVLGRYVREKKLVSLCEMIRRMTSLPASVYGLSSKGLLREGYDADICIFDADKIIDKADFVNCSLGAEGLNFVIVGGKITAEDAVYNGTKNGKFITR